MLTEYLNLFISIAVCSFVSGFMVVLSFLFGQHKPDSEKVSPYECGFNPFEDARKAFDVRFYIIGILFIIFDVEIVLLLPLIFIVNFFLPYVLAFLAILIFGFVYEWKIGVLQWS